MTKTDQRGRTMEFEEILGGFTFLEAPRVDAAGNLYFSEVMDGGVYRLTPEGKLSGYVTDRKFIGGLALTKDGGFITANRPGLKYYNPSTGEDRQVQAMYEGRPIVHINDIQPDDRGGLYVGGTHDPEITDAGFPRYTALYRVDPSGTAAMLWDGFKVSNGIGFSPDRSRLYFSETFEGVAVFDLKADGGIANKRYLTEFRGCDGLTVDAEGGIWVADYALGRVLRFLPDGTQEREFDFSTYFDGCRVTSLIFGGPDLKTLYVVTACDYQNLSAGAGRVYRAEADVAGQPTPFVQF
jgi:sugar lactone lactonase YvrE